MGYSHSVFHIANHGTGSRYHKSNAAKAERFLIMAKCLDNAVMFKCSLERLDIIKSLEE